MFQVDSSVFKFFKQDTITIFGHFGFNKTMELISRDFWWPKMWKLVKEYIQSCDTCSRSSASTPWTTSTFTYTISTMDINIIGFHY
jgi:hypothetical protein